jgi:hypothetical protein
MSLLSKAAEQQFGAGIWPDSGNDTAPMIVASNNVSYQNGRVGPVPANVPFFNSEFQVDRIWTQNIDTLDNIFFVSNKEVRCVIDETLTNVTYISSVLRPQFASFGNFTLMADGGKLAVRRGIDAAFERISTSPEADFVIVYSPFVIVFKNRTASWCSIDNIDLWAPAAENQARSLPIRDMDSDIVAVIRAFGGIVIFSEKRAWMMQFSGSPYWFGIQKLDITVGPFQQEAVCLVDELIYGVGSTGIWRTDGNSVQYFDRPPLRKWFYGKLGDPDEVLCVYDQSNERVIITFTDKDNVRSSVIYDVRYQNWYPTSNDFTAADRGEATRDIIFGDGRGRLLSQNQRTITEGGGGSGDGLRFKSTVIVKYSWKAQPFSGGFGRQINVSGGGVISKALIILKLGQQIIPALSGNDDVFFETREMDFGTTEEKYVDAVLFRVTRPGAGIFYFSYCVKNRIQDDDVWVEEIPQDPDQPCFLRETGRYFKYKVRNSSATTDWQLTSLDTYGEVVGGRL